MQRYYGSEDMYTHVLAQMKEEENHVQAYSLWIYSNADNGNPVVEQFSY